MNFVSQGSNDYPGLSLQSKSGSPLILCQGTHPKSLAGLHASSDEHTVARLKDVQGTREMGEGHHTRKDGQLHLITDANPMRTTQKEHRSLEGTKRVHALNTSGRELRFMLR